MAKGQIPLSVKITHENCGGNLKELGWTRTDKELRVFTKLRVCEKCITIVKIGIKQEDFSIA